MSPPPGNPTQVAEMDDTRVGGDAQGESDDAPFPMFQQAGVDNDEDVKGCKETVDSTRDKNEQGDQNEIEEKLNVVDGTEPVRILPEQDIGYRKRIDSQNEGLKELK